MFNQILIISNHITFPFRFQIHQEIQNASDYSGQGEKCKLIFDKQISESESKLVQFYFRIHLSDKKPNRFESRETQASN